MIPLEQQVCSLKWAQRLKELGVKQESLFYWCHHISKLEGEDDKATVAVGYYSDKLNYESDTEAYRYYAALTVAELGTMLPKNSFTMSGANPIHPWNRKHQEYVAGFWPQTASAEEIEEPIRSKKEPTMWYGDTEADARAKMLVYLLENKLITL